MMRSLLSLPSALQSLDITTHRLLRQEMNGISLAHLIRILAVQQPKLECLTYSNALESRYDDQIEGLKLDLSSLNKLKYLALPYDDGYRPWQSYSLIRYVGPSQGSPSLETVSIGVELELPQVERVLSCHRQLGLQSSQCPHLRTLIVALGGLDRTCGSSEDPESKRTSFLEDLKKGYLEEFKGSKVRIILKSTHRYRYKPPYLFGEKAPKRRTIFDSGADEALAGSNLAI